MYIKSIAGFKFKKVGNPYLNDDNFEVIMEGTSQGKKEQLFIISVDLLPKLEALEDEIVQLIIKVENRIISQNPRVFSGHVFRIIDFYVVDGKGLKNYKINSYVGINKFNGFKNQGTVMFAHFGASTGPNEFCDSIKVYVPKIIFNKKLLSIYHQIFRKVVSFKFQIKECKIHTSSGIIETRENLEIDSYISFTDLEKLYEKKNFGEGLNEYKHLFLKDFLRKPGEFTDSHNLLYYSSNDYNKIEPLEGHEFHFTNHMPYFIKWNIKNNDFHAEAKELNCPNDWLRNLF